MAGPEDGAVPERLRLHQVANRQGPAVPQRLLASWQRSEEYGVSLEGVEPVFTGTDGLSAGHGSLFYECGVEVLQDLQQTLGDEPVSMMLTDAEGVVVNRVSGDHALLRALDAVHLAPGFGYSERDVGTNGLGLALADRTPTLVRADQHYAIGLQTFTCAAVPVLDPGSGRVEGSVNLTTWASSSAELLLALARSAAGSTAALMLARSTGRRPRTMPRGRVFRVEVPRPQPGSATVRGLSDAWTVSAVRAEQGLATDRIVAAVGEPGSGRSTLLGQAARQRYPRDRILSAGAPAPSDIETWLGLWTPELGKAHTVVIVRDVDLLPTWAAERLRDLIIGARQIATVPVALTAERFEDIPAALAPLVDTVVRVPPLRDRPGDVLTLAAHLGRRARGRDIRITPAAARALQSYGWPGNVEQLARVVVRAATASDVVDVGDLPPDVLAGNTQRLSRIETFERAEIVRVLSRAEVTMNQAARELGMSRATLYRKISQYDIKVR